MPLLVHLTDASDAATIERVGLIGRPACFPGAGLSDKVRLSQAVFAMPCLPNELATHQWMTELLGRGMREIVAVHFEMDDHLKVWVGRYQKEHASVLLKDAVKRMESAADLRGWEIIIPGHVPAGAVCELRAVPCTVVPPMGLRLAPCEPGSHTPERLSPSVEPRLPI